jgi:hypothetical protein
VTIEIVGLFSCIAGISLRSVNSSTGRIRVLPWRGADVADRRQALAIRRPGQGRARRRSATLLRHGAQPQKDGASPIGGDICGHNSANLVNLRLPDAAASPQAPLIS